MDDLVKAMGMSGVSKSQVSRLCEEIDERVNAFLERPIEGDWPYLWLDATYVKVRQGGRIVSVAVIVAVAVNAQGRREVLGITVMPSEAETFWTEFLRSLTRRGLRGVKLVISDAHEGLKAAAANGAALNATWWAKPFPSLQTITANQYTYLSELETIGIGGVGSPIYYRVAGITLVALRPRLTSRSLLRHQAPVWIDVWRGITRIDCALRDIT